MSKSKASRTSRKRPKIPRELLTVRFEFWELETEAFQHLSADATRVYMLMHMRYNGSNNGAVVFSHRDAMNVLRSGWRRGSNALAELEHYGFIRCRRPGEPGPNIRPASEWQLTKFECGGQPASKTFARWDGTAFEPPYKGTEKQPPIVMVKTPRRQHEDASPLNGGDSDPEVAQSVGNMKTPPAIGRRQHEDTCSYTTQGGLPKSEQKGRAALSRHGTNGSAPRKPVRTYGGKPLLRDRALDLMRANRDGIPWTPTALAADLKVRPVETCRVLKELCGLGHARRIGHGRYMLTEERRA